MTKSELFALIPEYTQRTWATAQLESALVLAEARIARDLRSRWNTRRNEMFVTDGLARFGNAETTSGAALPADFRAPVLVMALFSPFTIYTFTRERDALRKGAREDAWAFTYVGDLESLRIRLWPEVPRSDADPSALNLDLTYFQAPTPLDEEVKPMHPASVFPDLYVHGVLMECARMTADDAAKESAMMEYAASLDLTNDGDEMVSDEGQVEPEPYRVIGG